MYYRKYFEGAIETTNAYKSVTINGTTTKQNCYIKQTDIINEAVEDTLLSAGIACEYDSETCILSIKGFPVQILAVNPTAYVAVYRYGDSSALFTTSTSYPTFSGVNYKFYVTLIGDPQSLLIITIGTYNNPALETIGIMLANMIDLRDQSRLVGLKNYNTSISSYYIHKEDGTQYSDITSASFVQTYTNNNVLTQSGSLIPLIDCIDGTGFLKMVNCYCGNNALSPARFYCIGGEIFYCYNNHVLARCTTEVP